MKIVFFTTYYEHYLKDFYRRAPHFDQKSYAEQYQQLTDDYYGIFSSYAKYLNRGKAKAEMIICNCKPMQRTWAKENNVKFNEKNWRYAISLAQIKAMKPDIFFMSSMFEYYGEFLEEVRKYVPNIFGWISCPIPSGVRLNQMDLILTSLPTFVDDFRNVGVNAEFLTQAFDSELFSKLSKIQQRDIDFSFIGSFTKAHLNRIKAIQKLIDKTPLKIFGTGINLIPDDRPLFQRLFSKSLAEKRYCGEAWGIEMFKALRRSKITFNSHIDISDNYAGNIRMYEATGMGTLLLTDGEKSKGKIFSDQEVVYYKSIEDAIDKTNYFLSHEAERESIATNGQQKTFKDYNYEKNSDLMYNYFLNYLN